MLCLVNGLWHWIMSLLCVDPEMDEVVDFGDGMEFILPHPEHRVKLILSSGGEEVPVSQIIFLVAINRCFGLNGPKGLGLDVTFHINILLLSL